MSDEKMKYVVDGQQMEEYLKRRFISVSISFSIIVLIIMTMLGFIFYKRAGANGLWSFLFSIPLLVAAFLYGVKRWHDKLRKFVDNEFVLTDGCIIQMKQKQVERNFSFSEIAVIDKRKFGTTILKGNVWTKINYYRSKRSAYQLDDPELIFVPSITTNYSELIERVKQQVT